jgi:hypothetical protein
MTCVRTVADGTRARNMVPQYQNASFGGKAWRLGRCRRSGARGRAVCATAVALCRHRPPVSAPYPDPCVHLPGIIVLHIHYTDTRHAGGGRRTEIGCVGMRRGGMTCVRTVAGARRARNMVPQYENVSLKGKAWRLGRCRRSGARGWAVCATAVALCRGGGIHGDAGRAVRATAVPLCRYRAPVSAPYLDPCVRLPGIIVLHIHYTDTRHACGGGVKARSWSSLARERGIRRDAGGAVCATAVALCRHRPPVSAPYPDPCVHLPGIIVLHIHYTDI